MADKIETPSLLKRLGGLPLCIVLFLTASVAVVELVFLLRLGTELALLIGQARPQVDGASMRGVTDFDPITAVGSLALILTVQVLLHVLLSKQLVRLSESVVRDLRSEAFGLMLETNGSRKADSGEADFVVLVLSRELGANLAAVLFGAGNGVLLFALFFGGAVENWIATVGGALAVISVLLITVPGARQLRRRARVAEEAEASALSFVTSAVDARSEIASLGVTSEVAEEGDAYFLETQRARTKSIQTGQLNSFLFRDALLALVASTVIVVYVFNDAVSESTVTLFLLALRAVGVAGGMNSARLALIRTKAVYALLSERLGSNRIPGSNDDSTQGADSGLICSENTSKKCFADNLRLQCDHVVVRFENRPLFGAQTWSAGPTGLVAVIGESGVGKTTFLEALQGLREVESGSISLNGVQVRSVTAMERRTFFGYAPQFPTLLPGTVEENLRFFRSGIDEKALLDALVLAQLTRDEGESREYMKQFVGAGFRELSGGERLRLGIARSLVCDPLVVFMDEPTSALSDSIGTTISTMIRELAEQRLILVATHNLALIELADQIVHLEP